MSKRPYSENIKSALRNPYHLIAAAAVFSLSVAMLDVTPLLAGLALEAGYLALVLIRASGVTIKVADDQAETDPAAQEAARQSAAATPAAQEAARQSAAAPSAAQEAARQSAAASPPPVPAMPPLTAPEAGEMLPVRAEQLIRLDAALRVIGMRLESGPNSLTNLAGGLTHLREKYILFARSEREHAQRIEQYLAAAREEEGAMRDVPATGQDAFAPSMSLLRDDGQRVPGDGEQGYRKQTRELLTRYDWQLREIAWQREQLPPGSESVRTLDAHTESLLRRRKYADRAGTLLTSLHYEMELIVRKFETICTDLSTRQPQQILSDIHALVIQSEAVARSLREIEPGDQPKTRNGV
jgi:hypothetical protein